MTALEHLLQDIEARVNTMLTNAQMYTQDKTAAEVVKEQADRIKELEVENERLRAVVDAVKKIYDNADPADAIGMSGIGEELGGDDE